MAMYEQNYEELRKVVADRSVIRHVSKHRNPDGSFDLEGNKKLWNAALERFQKIPLWENGTPNYDNRDPLQPEPSIIFVPGANQKQPRGTIIVAHGGGFESRTGCEGMNVAWFFANAGFNTAILTYRLNPYTRFDAMVDMQRAIRLLRARKVELGITDKVVAMGFSAGGMLSGNCATHFDLGEPNADDPIQQQSCRPDAAVLGYGAFAFTAFPAGLFRNPFERSQKQPFARNREELYYLAPEANVTLDTPPFFIWQTNSDDPRHAFALGGALTAAGVPFELMCFTEGVHGLALADGENDLSMNIPHVHRWAELCAEWLETMGI